ncbi:MAG: ROK family protein [Firmicutes bacterium]|nr:ROK family protein [Bacillota bacterium]
MSFKKICSKAKLVPVLDKDYRPAVLENRAFLNAVKESGAGVPLVIALERAGGLISTYTTEVFAEDHEMAEENFFYVERLVKALLWIKGGWKIIIGGPKSIGEYIQKAYAAGGIREFDAKFMSRVYEKPFTVEIIDAANVPAAKENAKAVGRHLDGCRIGFDAGGSDRKVSAVIDGEVVYSEEVVWHPKLQENPDYHYEGILAAMKTAASKMPRVDAIGVSAAGIYINNRAMVASLFIKIPDDLFDQKVKDIFLNVAKEVGDVPVAVANDGDVAALAGAMCLKENNVLGVAMGTSEAVGYVDGNGNITGWLNELAFSPVDYNPDAMVDEWSGDFGVGCKYFSQDAVIKLAPAAGIELDESLSLAEKLKVVQNLHKEGHQGARQIFETIGIYFGYAIAYYAAFYDIQYLQILGRVTSGKGGDLIIEGARKVLEVEFPELAEKIKLYVPDEYERRVGQSIAAASLPEL